MEVVRSSLHSIHTSIARIEAKGKIPIPGDSGVVADYEHLLNLEEMGVDEFVPEGLKERFSVRELLNGIESEEQRVEGRRQRELGVGRTPPRQPSLLDAVELKPNFYGVGLDLKVVFRKLSRRFRKSRVTE